LDQISAQVILKNVFLSFFLANTHHGYLMQRYPAAREGYTRIRKEEKKQIDKSPERNALTHASERQTPSQAAEDIVTRATPRERHAGTQLRRKQVSQARETCRDPLQTFVSNALEELRR
jgi:hypothetical protein